MSSRKRVREIEKVVDRVMKTAGKFDRIGKSEFETILHMIIESVQDNTGLELEQIIVQTGKVVEDMPHEYGRLAEHERTTEIMIGYLYVKFLKELGVED